MGAVAVCALAAVAGVWVGRSGHSQSARIHVVLLLGQSNISGRGADYSPTLDPGDPRILQFTATRSLETAKEPLGFPDPDAAGGPGLAFAREYLRSLPARDKILLIPAAYGGTGFSTPDSNGGNLSWDVSKPATQDNLYARSLTQLQDGIASVRATGANTQLSGALINLGDTDSLNHIGAAAYQADLDALIKGYRRRLNVPDLPFVIGPSRPDAIAHNSSYQHINAVQIATPSRIMHTAYIPGAVGVEYYNSTDKVHYDQAGNRAMGLQYAHALLGLINGPPTLSAPSDVKLAGSAGATRLQLTWNIVPGATGYQVSFKARTDTAWTVFATTAALDAQLKGLSASTSYDIEVRAVDGTNQVGPANSTYAVSTTP